MIRESLEEYGLFNGIAKDAFKTLFPCIGSRMQIYKEGEDMTEVFGDKRLCVLILSGKADVLLSDDSTYHLKEDDIFSTNLLHEHLELSRVTAKSQVDLLVMNWEGIWNPCWFSCHFHHKLAENTGRLWEESEFY